MMNKLLLSLLLLIPFSISAQNNIYTSGGISQTVGPPTYTPGRLGNVVAIDTATGYWYVTPNRLSGTAWLGFGFPLANISGSVPPAFTPTKFQPRFVINAVDSMYYYNGTAWKHVNKGGGGGITSLNGLTAGTQTFATGTTGTNFNIASSASTHTFNLPTAGLGVRGALSSADWSTFNGKANALSGVTGYVSQFNSSSTIDTTGIFWNAANGRLGIGTTSPASLFQVVGGESIFRASVGSTNIIHAQNSNPNTVFRVANDGAVHFGSSGSIRWFPITTQGGAIDFVSGTNFSLYSGTISQSTLVGRLHIGGEIHTQTSGDNSHLYLFDRFSPTSGTATSNTLALVTQINQTGGANGITRGIYINPLLTSAADWRSIEWSSNTGWGLYGAGTANNYLAANTSIGTTTTSARLHVRGSNTSSGTNAFLVQNSRTPTPDDIYKIENNGKISYLSGTGTTSNTPSGTVDIAAGASSVTVSNSLVSSNSIVFAVIRTNDSTAQIKNVVPGASTFTINLVSPATGTTSVGWRTIN